MKFLREPLVHFLLIGALLFAVYEVAGKTTNQAASDRKITVSAKKISQLTQGFLLDNGHPATDADVQRLIDGYIREEILVRQAVAEGLDHDDSIVRRRLAQRMEFTTPEPAPPKDADLQSYFTAHADDFRAPDGKLPDLKDVRPAITAAWMTQQRKKSADDMYQRLRSQYQITIEPAKGTP